MHTDELRSAPPIQSQDVVRWLTFTGFWGSIFYLLACVSMVLAHRRQPLRLDAKTAAVGMGIHVGAFVVLGSLGSAIAALVRGKSTTEQAEERIRSGALERSIVAQGLGGAAGSPVPFALAVASLRAAEKVTGRPAFAAEQSIRWPQATAIMALVSGLVALAVSRIAGWVARDARSGPS